MITRLVLRNFKQHADSELYFDDSNQLVLIGGKNGAGKSSILESVLFAIYGEVGTRGALERTVRRGAQLEGMSVELDLKIGDTTYTVARRRDGGQSTAILRADGLDIVKGPKQVTAELTKILGLDVTAFRLAAYSEQKQVDKFARVTDTERRQALFRLLRLDVVQKASQNARDTYNNYQKALAALGPSPDLDAINKNLHDLRGQWGTYNQQLIKTQEGITAFDRKIKSFTETEARYHKAKQEAARAEGSLSAAREELSHLRKQLEAIEVPEPLPAPTKNLSQLQADASLIERELAKAEAASSLKDQRVVTIKQLERIREEIERIETELSNLASPAELDSGLMSLEASKSALEASVAEKRDHLEHLVTSLGEARARLNNARRSLESADSLEAVCPTCAQEVDDSHKHDLKLQYTLQLDECKALLTTVESEIEDTKRLLSTDVRALDTTGTQINLLTADLTRMSSLGAALDEVRSREVVYKTTLDRLPDSEIDMDSLYVSRSRTAVAIAAAEAWEANERMREASLARQDAIASAITAAQAREDQAKAVLDASGLDSQLEDDFNSLIALREARAQEVELAAFQARQSAVLAEKVTAAQALADQAVTEVSRRSDLTQKALTASRTAEVLKRTADRLSTQIRPSLQGAVSTMLASLSEGRFSEVKVDDQYNFSVYDGNTYVPVSDLSGGEQDLVALAIRLSLATVVAERHGSGGPGFLILDETFGSQDTVRRNSILTVLRSLRDTYGQVLLVSHVEGVEEAADAIIEVTQDIAEDGSITSKVIQLR